MLVTSLEQSKRLMSAGLSPDTADFYYYDPDSKNTVVCFRQKYDGFMCGRDVPAWSVCALWEILKNANVYYYSYDTGDSIKKVLESLVEAVSRLIRKRKNEEFERALDAEKRLSCRQDSVQDT